MTNFTIEALEGMALFYPIKTYIHADTYLPFAPYITQLRSYNGKEIVGRIEEARANGKTPRFRYRGTDDKYHEVPILMGQSVETPMGDLVSLYVLSYDINPPKSIDEDDIKWDDDDDWEAYA